MKKRAFTLGEFMITFLIIGVIAAMTLPALRISLSESQRTAGVKSTFAKLTETWNLAVMEIEYAPKCAYTSSTEGSFQDCEDFGKKIEELLIIKQTCYGGGSAKGCIAQYSTEFDSIAPAGFKAEDLNTKNTVFLLNDGITIINSTEDAFLTPQKFAIDINGKKGPNKWGHDLFPLQSKFGKDGKKIYIVGIDIAFDKEVDKDAINVSEILANKK